MILEKITGCEGEAGREIYALKASVCQRKLKYRFFPMKKQDKIFQ
jgi:hypothetical protein